MGQTKADVRIDDQLLAEARQRAAAEGTSVGGLIEQAIRKYLAVATVREQSFGDVVRELQDRGPQVDEDDAMALAYEELHAMRRERDAG